MKQIGNKLIKYHCFDTIIGLALIAASEDGICFLAFDKCENALIDELKLEFPRALLESKPNSKIYDFARRLENALKGHWDELSRLPLDPVGTPFQLKVWSAIQQIPVGSVSTYKKLAHKIGLENAHRAAARGCAANKIALLIPCHRVIRSNGTLGGYRWGLKRKEELLNLEACLIPSI
ncbi:MAG: methylated-DNA--[protein]-cysteine S-methyltransferase [Alphaproteobacteria bacterium]